MGQIVLNAFLSYIQKNPQVIEELISAAVTWIVGELRKNAAAKVAQ